MNMQEIWQPAIIINLRRFRDFPTEWYATINEDKNGALYTQAQELKDACGFKWANGIYRVDANGLTGDYHLHRDTSRAGKERNLWQFTIYHDKWGSVFHISFVPDADGKIPQEIINAASERMTRVANGYVRCFDCGGETAYTESHGMYYDNRYCSPECAKKHEKSDRERSR